MIRDVAIRKAVIKDKPYKISAGGGLFALVNPNGSKLWRLKYRVNRKEKLLSLGKYPDVGLADAFRARDEARQLLANGADPSAVKREVKHQERIAAANTFKAVAEEWLDLNPGNTAEITQSKARWLLRTYAYPQLGSMPISSIEPRHVLSALRVLENAGKLESMHRLKTTISMVIRLAVVDGRAKSDPCRDLKNGLKKRETKRHHSAILDRGEFGQLLRDIDGYSGTAEVSAAMRLAAHVFVRPGELRQARWADIDLDSDQPAWRYYVTKTKTDHVVPLSEQAVSILRELCPLTDTSMSGRPDFKSYVFPSARSRAKPMSENTVNQGLRRLGYSGDRMTGHGFRAVARTFLAEMGWRSDVIERQLAHKQSGPNGAAYDRAQFLEDRRQMMQAWSDYLDTLRNGESKVIPMNSKVA